VADMGVNIVFIKNIDFELRKYIMDNNKNGY
jgi:hypothetical protein